MFWFNTAAEFTCKCFIFNSAAGLSLILNIDLLINLHLWYKNYGRNHRALHPLVFKILLSSFLTLIMIIIYYL